MAISAPPQDGQGGVPPQNLEAEASVLGSILMTEQALDRVVIEVGLKSDHFYRPRHQLIFRAMLRLKEKSQPEAVDALTVCNELKRSGDLAEAGEDAYVHSLPTMVAAVGNVIDYARIVKEHAMLRSVLRTSRDIQERILSRQGDPRELIEQAEKALFQIGHEDGSGELRSIEDVLHEELDKLERLSREGLDVTGTPSDFKDLDDLLGGFQKGNLIVLAARPSMGKCLGGGSLVYDPTTGARRRLDEVVQAVEQGDECWVASLGADLKLRPARVTESFRNGRRRLYTLTTRLGREIRATSNHPVLTIRGWKHIDELAEGERIAVPRELPVAPGSASVPDHELVMLAALIADGCLLKSTPEYCFGPDSPVVGEVREAARTFGLELRVSPKGPGTARITAGRGSGANPVRQLCEQHGVWGKRSGEKFVPDAIFGLDEASIVRFLSILFACDGYVHAGRLRHVGYTTISERLARDVQHLLLRLGIVSVIRTLPRKVYEGTDVVAREVRVTGQEDLRTFARKVQVAGKQAALDRLREGLARVGARTNLDNLPLGAWDYILTAKGSRSWAEISEATGRPRRHNWHVGTRQLLRRLVVELAEQTDDEVLSLLAGSDLWWDQVMTIEPGPVEETYDLTVPDHHNFVADDVIVHNSSLVTNIAENAAVNHSKPVALFSLEMSETELAQRFIASQARIGGDELRKGRVKADRWPKVVKATEKLANAPLYVDDSSDIGITEIRAKARRLHARFQDQGGLGLLIVDYLQLMRADDTAIGRVEQIAHMSRGLKILARELHIPVIAVSQLSRAVEARPDKRPLLSDLRESGAIEQDSDVVVFIYRDEYYNRESERPGEADLIVAKHRNGPIGEVTLTFLPRYPKFANFARDPAAEAGARQLGGSQ